MKITGQFNNQEEMELTLSITMILKEWKDLQKDLPERYPHWKLGSAITDAVLNAEETIYKEIVSAD